LIISNRHKILAPLLDEKAHRLMVAAESKVLGGGIGIVSKSTGVSRTTISTGLKELKEPGLIDKSRDTTEFAVETIKKWWTKMGKPIYSDAQKLLITTDGGGSNSSRSRLCKAELQKLANETGLIIEVCHFPSATSK